MGQVETQNEGRACISVQPGSSKAWGTQADTDHTCHSHTAESRTWGQPGFTSRLFALCSTGSVQGLVPEPAWEEHPESIQLLLSGNSSVSISASLSPPHMVLYPESQEELLS